MVFLLLGNSFLLPPANSCFPKRGDVAQSAPCASLRFPAAAPLRCYPFQIRHPEFAKPWMNITQKRSSHSKSMPHIYRKHSLGMVVGGCRGSLGSGHSGGLTQRHRERCQPRAPCGTFTRIQDAKLTLVVRHCCLCFYILCMTDSFDCSRYLPLSTLVGAVGKMPQNTVFHF